MDRENVDIRSLAFFKKMHQLKRCFMNLRDKALEHPNVTHDQMMVMVILAHNGKMKVSRLSEEMGLSISTVSGILDRMESGGLISRERCNSDRRVVHIALEDSYNKMFDKMKENIESNISAMMGKMTDGEISTVEKAFDIMIRVMGELEGERK